MLQLLEDDQMVAGSGATPNLRGIFKENGVQLLDVSATGDFAQLDSLRVARRLIKTGLSRLTADAVVLNPVDSEGFDLMKNTYGDYRGGNPVGNFTYDQPLWGLRRVESEAIPEGYGIVGAFKAGATVQERQGITVYSTDSHSDFFVKNLIAILFEERIGFPIFYPSAFCIVKFGSTVKGGSGDIDLVVSGDYLKSP
jgi:HK97 family phage major capsid protein